MPAWDDIGGSVAESLAVAADAYTLYGLNFGPYTEIGEDPDHGNGQVTLGELEERMTAVSSKATWLRTFGCTGDLAEAGQLAHELGNTVALGAWIDSDLATNQAEIDSLVNQAVQGHADMVIVGSEALFREDVSEEILIGYINDVKGRLMDAGISIPVTTAAIHGTLTKHPAVIDAVDVVLANYYPFWERNSIDTAVARLHRSHQTLTAMAGGKEVIVSETGWPSDGQQLGDAVPSPENSAFYFLNFVSWARAGNVKYFYFEANDEPWKVKNEGEVGAHWGIFADTVGGLKPGMEKVFQGDRMPDNWTNPPGAPIRDFFSQPDQIPTNIDTFLIAGVTEPGYVVKLDGAPLPATSISTQGEFSHPVALVPGQNALEVTVETSLGAVMQTASKTVIYDASFSTHEERLLYVDVVPGGFGSPDVDGTIVIDLDGDAVLGLLEDLHVRGISPDGTEVYMHDKTVINTGTHQVVRTLPFSQNIPGNGFLVSPTGTRLYSGNEVVDLQSNALLDALPMNITTGSSWASAPIPGGPAISADGTMIHAGNAVARIDLDPITLDGGTITDTGVTGHFMSDLEVSPDGSRLLVSAYADSGHLDVYSTDDYSPVGTPYVWGDFAGEISFLDDETLVVGSAGNPSFRDGFLSLIDLETVSFVQYERIPLAANVEVSTEDREVFVSTGAADPVTGDRFGVDVWVWGQDGRLFQTETFSLGINRSITSSGRPAIDQIRNLSYKPQWPKDFGDAPGSGYPTLLASDGARHRLGGPLWLGSTVDSERDAQPDDLAEGDDRDLGGDDEDGVVFTSPLLTGQTATVDVTVSTAGVLNAWIDFTADGDWDDPGEQVFADVTLSGAGTHSLAYDVPAAMQRIQTFARFRVSTVAGLSHDGLAPDGEVEDHRISVTAAPGTPDLLLAHDTGANFADNITNLNNGDAGTLLAFDIGGTINGAALTVYANGRLIASAVATEPTTRVTTDGTYLLSDRRHLITAMQVADGKTLSTVSNALSITVDTQGPTVANVSVSDPLITETDTGLGRTFTVTVEFDEAMTTVGPGPDIIFIPSLATTLYPHLSVPSNWLNPTTYQAVYGVNDADQVVRDVEIDVAGARDAAGNDQRDYTPHPGFSIDTLNTAPIADPGGPYRANEGGTIILDASGSSDAEQPDNTQLTYEWDFDRDGHYDDATGMYPVFRAADGDESILVRLRVTDADGLAGTGETIGQVDNVRPAITLSGAAEIDEGTAYDLTLGPINDPGIDTVTKWIVHWGDGASDTYALGTHKSHIYGDDDPTGTVSDQYSITVDLVDEDGTHFNAGSKQISVTNVPPTVAILDPPADSPEGTRITLAAQVTDPGSDSFTYAWAVTKDGASYDTGTEQAFGFTPDDNGSYVFSLFVTDDDTGTGSATPVTILVANVAPTLIVQGGDTVAEGSDYTLTLGMITDPGIDTVSQWIVHWGDGTSDTYADGGEKTHSYLDDEPGGSATDPYTIRVDLVDEDGTHAGAGDKQLTVTNVAPDVEILGAPADSREGVAISLSAQVDDLGVNDTFAYSWAVTKDGNPYETGSASTFTFTPDDGDAEYVTSLTVTDDDTGTGEAAPVTILVTDVTPAISIEGPDTTAEGADYVLSLGDITEPGNDIVTQWTIHWGDGTSDTYADGGEKTHSYLDDEPSGSASDPYTITIDLLDEDGTHTGAGGKDVAVTNVAPGVEILGAPADSPEGVAISLSAQVDDLGVNDTFAYSWAVTKDGNPYETGSASTFTFTPDDGDAEYVTSLTVTDDDTGTGEAAPVTILVTNVTPTLIVEGGDTVAEGSDYTLTLGTITDPGIDTVTQWIVHWGDGISATYADGGEKTHIYLDDEPSGSATDPYTIRIDLVDEDGTHAGAGSKQLTVTNVAPGVEIVGAPDSISEGGRVELSAIVSDLGANDIHAYSWAVTKDGGPFATGVDATFGFTADDGDAEYVVSLMVTDDDAGVGNAAPKAIAVVNVPPAIVLSGDDTVDQGDPYTLTLGDVTDPGEDTVTGWTVNWGDGLSDSYGSGGQRTHVYAADGAYTLTVDLLDEDGTHTGTGSRDVTVNPVGREVADLGQVDFLEIPTVDPSAGDLYYRLETTHLGFLTIEADGESSDVATLALYDKNWSQPPLATASMIDGVARLDLEVDSAKEYGLLVTGTATSVDLTLANLVRREGATVTVAGTNGDDTFEFNAATSRDVTINGVRYHFDDAEAETVTFDGGDGYDMVILDDSPGDDTINAEAKHAVFANSDQTPGFSVTTDAVEELHAYARAGGIDRAFFHDSDGNDKFKSEPAEDYAKMYGGRMYNRVKFFDTVEAFSSGEKDLARLFDTRGDDVFEGQQDVSWLRTGVFDVGVHNFRRVIAHANQGGHDVATLNDSALKDEVHLKGHKSEIFDQTTDGDVYKITARRFDIVHADGSQGVGHDKVKMWDTSHDNRVEADANWARMLAQTDQLETLYDILAFEFVKVRASTGGSDTTNITQPLDFDLLFEDGWDQ